MSLKITQLTDTVSLIGDDLLTAVTNVATVADNKKITVDNFCTTISDNANLLAGLNSNLTFPDFEWGTTALGTTGTGLGLTIGTGADALTTGCSVTVGSGQTANDITGYSVNTGSSNYYARGFNVNLTNNWGVGLNVNITGKGYGVLVHNTNVMNHYESIFVDSIVEGAIVSRSEGFFKVQNIRTHDQFSGTISDTYDQVYFDRNSGKLYAGGTYNAGGTVLRLRNATTTAGSGFSDSVNVLKIEQSSTSYGNSILVDHLANSPAIYVNSSNTDTVGNYFISSNLTSGSIARFYSNTGNAQNRNLVQITNYDVSAVGAVPLHLEQNAVISTNFKKYISLDGVELYKSDGTDPNGALTGVAGDICFNGPNNDIYRCTGIANWSTYISSAPSFAWGASITGTTGTGLTLANTGTGNSIDITNTGNDGYSIFATCSNVLHDTTNFYLSNEQVGTLIDRTAEVTYFLSNRINTATAGTITDNFNAFHFQRLESQNGAGGTLNSMGTVVNIVNTVTQTAGTITDSAIALKITQDVLSTGSSIFIDHNGSGIGFNMDAENTTTNTFDIQADVLTSGSIARFYSNSTNASARSLVSIVNDNTVAIGTVPLYLQQDAAISSSFRKYISFDNNKYIYGANSNPNGALTANHGDIAIGGGYGEIHICNQDGGSVWRATAQKGYKNIHYVNTATASLLDGDEIVSIHYSNTGASTFNLTTAESVNNRIVIISDIAGNASVNNITVSTEGSQLINGQNTYIINTNYGSVRLYYILGHWYTW